MILFLSPGRHLFLKNKIQKQNKSARCFPADNRDGQRVQKAHMMHGPFRVP
jgi:hypothetical protein